MVQHLSSVGNLETTTNGKSKAIPLPPPQSTQFGNGNAYGGNQSFVHSSNDLIMGTPLINVPSSYWDSSSTPGSSTSGVRVPGVVGLTNIGNTCFMNSGLQCLLNTSAISEFFLKSKLFSGNLQKLSLLNHFQYVVKQAWYGPNSKINLQEFKSCLATIHSQFNDSRQHDCQEFLALLLDSLHEQLKKWTENQRETQVENTKSSEDSSQNLAKIPRPLTPALWKDDDSSVAEVLVQPSGKEISVALNKEIRPKNLPDALFSNDRKQSGLYLRSIETVSKSKPTGRYSGIHRNYGYSGLKSQHMGRNRLSTFDSKHKSKNLRLRGATISLFQLPNFTPPGHISNVNCDKDISSSTTDTATIKENKWMELRNRSTFIKSIRNRRKKYDDGDSPGSAKKLKYDVHIKSGNAEAKRKIESVNENSDRPEKTKTARLEESISTNGKPDNVHLVNGNSHAEEETVRDNISNNVDNKSKLSSKKYPPPIPTKAEEAARAKSFWEKHINANNTVIAKTFQGLLKSTVICATCSYNSVTYEPFMYLSLPFPRVLERKISVWFISMKDRRPAKLEVTVGLMDSVKKLKHEVGKKIPGDVLNEEASEKLLLAEVFNYCVHRIMDNNTLIRKLNDNHNLYVFELNENFDDRYNSSLATDADSYSFSNSFMETESVSSTTRGQMSASTYLDEDWDQEAKPSDEADSHRVCSSEPIDGTAPAYKSSVDMGDWDASPDEPPSLVQDADSSGFDNPSSSKLQQNKERRDAQRKSCSPNQPNGSSEIDASEEPNSTMEGNWSGDICAMEPNLSNETDDSGLGSGTSESAYSACIGGTCEATDADFHTGNVELGFSGVACESSACCSSVSTSEASPARGEVQCSKVACSGSEEQVGDVDCSSESNEVSGSTDGCKSETRTNSSFAATFQGRSGISKGSAKVASSTEENGPWKADVKSQNIQPSTMHCIICLEDCPLTEMRRHLGCNCTICVNCVRSSIQHFVEPKESSCKDKKLKCATCMKVVDGSEFVPYITPGENGSVKLTMELIPIVFRLDPNPDANNNSAVGPRIFGYPWLVKLPSCLPAKEFYEYMETITPFPQVESKVLNVTTDGKACGLCGYGSSCTGCELPKQGKVNFRPRTTIAIAYVDLSPELVCTIEPTDMVIEEHSFGSPWTTPNEPNYDIHDCLRAFSEIEHLDEQNPWFCPHCEKNQCAKKVLSVCHFPDYLIVYLKRFVFLDHSSNKLNNKLKFPVSELDLSEYIAEECSGKDWKYDLYGCICHFGSVSSGHYTAFGKNPASGDWHYFNDDLVSPQCPKDLEHSSAYVLFYSRKGVKYDIPLQAKIRPLPALNTLNISRPINIVTPSNSDNEPWEPEDVAEVTSSSSEYTYQTRSIHCSYGGGTVDTMEEVSLSVQKTHNKNGDSTVLSSRNSSEDWESWDPNEESNPVTESYKCESNKYEANSEDQYETEELANGRDFKCSAHTVTASSNDLHSSAQSDCDAADISRESDSTETLD